MDFFRTMVLVAAAAGLIAGLGMTVAQQFTTVPLILKAEVFEQAGEAKAGPQHEHADAGAHEHDEGWAPSDGFERTAFTLAANVITGIGFALLLIAVSELAGGIFGWRQVSVFRLNSPPCRGQSSGLGSCGGLAPWLRPPRG